MNRLYRYIQRDANLKALLRGAGLMYVAGLFSIGLTFLQQITTASILGIEDYGLFAIVISSTIVLTLVLDVRTWELATKLLMRPILDKDSQEVVRISTWLKLIDIILGIIGAGILIILAEPIALQLLRDAELTWLLRLYAVTIPLRMYSAGVPPALVRIYNRFDWLSYKSISYAATRLVFISGFAYLGWGLEGAIIGAILSEILNVLLFFTIEILIWRTYNPSARFADLGRPQNLGVIWKLLPGSWLFATLKSFQMESFIPLTAVLTSPIQVGILRSGFDIADLINKLVTPLAIVMFPKIIESYERGKFTALLRTIYQSSVLMGILVIPVMLCIVLMGPILIPDVLGPQFISASTVATLMSLGFSVNAVFLWTRPALVAVNLIRAQNILSLVLMTVLISGLFVFTPSYGAIGTALVVGSFFVVFNIASGLLFLKGTIWRPQTREERLS